MYRVSCCVHPEATRKNKRQECTVTQEVIDAEFESVFTAHDGACKITVMMRDGSRIKVEKV